MSVWERIRDWAATKHRDEYTQRHGVNLKCPHCHVWSSDCSTPSSFKNIGHPIAVQYSCGQCEKPSYWFCEAGFWFTADQLGIEINDEQQRSS